MNAVLALGFIGAGTNNARWVALSTVRFGWPRLGLLK